jgi:hypothetical protein
MADEFTTIATAATSSEAHIMRGVLESAGIEVFVLDEHASSMYVPRLGLMEPIRVQVRSERAQEALDLLDQPAEILDGDGAVFLDGDGAELSLTIGDTVEAVATSAEDEGELLCPACRSDLVYRKELSALQQLAAMLLLGIPYLFVRRPWECRSCGHFWTGTEPESVAGGESASPPGARE